MNYGEKVLSRLMTPGMLLVAIGAVLAYGSGWFVRSLPETKRSKTEMMVKATGCIAAFAGAVLLFT